MEPKELAGWPENFSINEGDILTIEGMYSRPSIRTTAWWTMLVFGPPFACRYCGGAFRRKISDPMYFIPRTRRQLFAKRQLQTFKAQKSVTSV
jgi:hypothetical protein